MLRVQRDGQPFDSKVSPVDCGDDCPIHSDGPDRVTEQLAVPLAHLHGQLVSTGDQGAEDGEVYEMPLDALVKRRGECGSFEDECSEQVRLPDLGLAPVMVDGDQLGSVDCLVGSSGFQGGAACDSSSCCGLLTDVLCDEEIDGGIAAGPPVLMAFWALTGGLEADVNEGLGDLMEDGRLRAHIQNSIRVVGRAIRRGVAFDAPEAPSARQPGTSYSAPSRIGRKGRAKPARTSDRVPACR